MDPHLSAGPGPLTAIVPLKTLHRAKGRLAGHLDPGQRRRLVEALFTTVLTACRASAGVDRIVVVAGDVEAERLVRGLGVEVLREPRPGLRPALAAADALVAADHRPRATLVVAADLPLCTPADIDAVVAAAVPGSVVVAPTEDGGTGALLRWPGRVIPTAFGRGSAAAHLRLAASAGVAGRRVERPGLALDIDTVEQLRRAARLGARLGAAVDPLSA